MPTIKTPAVDPAPATIAAELARHAGHITPPLTSISFVAADDAGSLFVLDVDAGSMVALGYFSVTKVRSRPLR
jgi:hypothetical protein